MIKLVSAKCPNCGATLRLSKENEKTECEYCHNTIIVEDAIACYRLKVSGNVSVEGITTNAELIEAANELLDMNEFLKAKRKFLEFSEKCPDNYQGWLGLLICRTRNFTIRDNNIMFENDISKYREHFFRTAPKDIKDQYFETIDRYFDPDKYKRMEEESAEEKRKLELEEQKKIAQEKKLAKKENDSNNPSTTKVWNIILYGLGGLVIFGGLDYLSSDLLYSILTILFGLSLFQVLYIKVGEKFNIDEKKLKVARIVLPIILLFLVGLVAPTETADNNANDDRNTNTQEKTDSKTKESKVVFLKNTKAKDYYGVLCEVTGLTINEPMNIIGDINEYSSYDNNFMIEVGANKTTDEIAYITITTIGDVDSTNAFMALNRVDYNGKDSGKLTSFITENMGNIADITIGDLNFSMWTNNGKPIIKAETPDFEKYIEEMK